MRILMVLTSHAQLGDTGKKTGFWLEEFAAPYYQFKDSGVEVVLASPAGGEPPLDPNSDQPDFQTAMTERFRQDKDAQYQLANTLCLSEVKAEQFDALFYPGGHGPLWDLANSKASISLIESFVAADKPTGFVCHAPGVLRDVKNPDGSPLVAGKKLTGFSNSEEAAVQLTNIVPFLLEDELTKLGANYVKGDDWGPFVVAEGKLITGQNPASSTATARTLLAKLESH